MKTWVRLIALAILAIFAAPAEAQEVLTITKIDTPPATDLTLEPTSDVLLNPTGKEVLPTNGYEINLGRLTRKYLALHAAELWVETLVAQNTMATIGGRIIVAPTNILTLDLPAANTSMAVKYNNIAIGEVVMMEANGFVEFMGITGGPSGSGPYVYSMVRNLDGSGANDWTAGDAVLNTGAAGNGFLDIYSVRGLKRSSYVDGSPLTGTTEIGPTIVGNVRTGSTYNQWEPRWAVGNLDGVYGYTEPTFGAAFGTPGAARVTIDPTNGIVIYGGDNDPKVTIDASGNATFDGGLTVGTGRNQIRNSECRVSTDDWSFFTNHGLGTALSFNLASFRLNNESNTCFAAVSGTPAAATVTNMFDTVYMPVTAGFKYEASAYIGLHRATSAAVTILWYNSSAALLSTSTSNTCTTASSGGTQLSAFCRAVVLANAPTNATTARIQVGMIHNGTEADPYLFAVRSYFGEASLTQEDPTPWGAAGLTTINNGLIETDAINARVISADSITASELAANSITAGDILAGTITATEIAGNTITADRLNVSTLSAISGNMGTLTAGSITGGTIDGATIRGGSGDEVTIDSSGISISGGTGTNNRIKWTGGHEMWGTSGGIYTNGSFSIEDVLVVGGGGSGAVDLSVDDIGVGASIQFANMLISTGTAVIWETACGCLKKVSSSARYKEHIKPWFATDAQRLLTLTPISFDYRGDGVKGVVGFSAEELYLVAPEAVNLDAQGRPDSIRQDAVNAYLLQIIKELRAEIDDLKSRR